MKTSMTTQEALKVLGVTVNPVTQEKIKQSYRLLAKKYHPDRNPNGLEMMKIVNVAYQYLSDLGEPLFFEQEREQPKTYRAPSKWEEYEEELDYFRSKGLIVRCDGLKIYISGKTFIYREQLKELKFRWNPDTKEWWLYD